MIFFLVVYVIVYLCFLVKVKKFEIVILNIFFFINRYEKKNKEDNKCKVQSDIYIKINILEIVMVL